MAWTAFFKYTGFGHEGSTNAVRECSEVRTLSDIRAGANAFADPENRIRSLT
jgi:hypothetical protein